MSSSEFWGVLVSPSEGANFIKKLSRPCAPPRSYGIDNLKKLSQGKLPRAVRDWPLAQVDDSAGTLENRVAEYPLSD